MFNTHKSIVYIFKYVDLILLSLFSSSLFAQSFIEKQDNLFQNLNKTKITTGVLYDRVYSWSDLNVISEEIPKINYSFGFISFIFQTIE